MPDQILIRPFEPERDMERFLVLNEQTFWESIPDNDRADLPNLQGKFSRTAFREHYAQLMKHYKPDDPARSRISVAVTAHDSYAGHCWLGIQMDFFTNKPVPWVLDLTVRPEWRGQGVGRVLLQNAVDYSIGLGYGALGLQVMAHNEKAKKFYEHAGFVVRSFALHRKLTPDG